MFLSFTHSALIVTIGLFSSIVSQASCPNGLGGVVSAPNVSASFTNSGNTSTYKFYSLMNQGSSGGLPGLVEYCIYPSSGSPIAMSTSIAGANGAAWSTTGGSPASFSRPGGNPSNLPLDGGTYTMGTATWSTLPASQEIIIHINDASTCASLYGSGSASSCFVKPAANPLPITLVSFEGYANKGLAQLTWKTAEEMNFASFTVERSNNGADFSSIEEVSAKGSNSSYSFDDRPGMNKVFYRLRMNDRDGTQTYSSVVVLALQNAEVAFSAYPNPVALSQSINVTLSSAQNESAMMTITNTTGQVVATRILNLQAGVQTLSIGETASLAAGTYFIQVTTQQGAQTSRFIVR